VAERGTRRRKCPREQEPHERRTRKALERPVSFLKGPCRRRGARAEAKLKALKRDQLHEGRSRDSRSTTRSDEENPEVVTNDVGGALEANKALLAGH